MKKIILIGALLLIMLIVLTGCSYEEVSGEVINKEYTPKRVTVQPIYTGKFFSTIPVVHSEKWSLQIQYNKNRRNENNLG